MIPDVRYFKPGNDISWLVKQFEAINFYSKKGVADKFVPRQDASLVFHFGSLPLMMSPAEHQLPRYFIAPLVPTANRIMIKGRTDVLIVTCNPTILSRILGISMIRDKKVCLNLPKHVFNPVWETMKKHNDPEGRIKAFSEFIHDLYPGNYIPDETDMMFEKICNSSFTTQLRDIISDFQICERTVQRRFRERLGITPKMLSRIVKINYLWNTINSKGPIDYQDLVFLGNYFDQTHFIKDFKAMTGETPDYFFKRNLNVVRILSGRAGQEN